MYSLRQPELVQPLFDAFTKETGIAVNVAFVQHGMVERLVAEGSRSPADLVMTVDIARLMQVVDAGVTQAVSSPALDAAIPAEFRDPAGHWFGADQPRPRRLCLARTRGRWRGDDLRRPCRPEMERPHLHPLGHHDYNVALAAAYLAHHGEAETVAWLEGLKANLARKPEGGDRDQVKAIWAGQCDIRLATPITWAKCWPTPSKSRGPTRCASCFRCSRAAARI